MRMARVRIRVPEHWYGDFLALLGAARIGERRLLELASEVGGETLERYERDWFDYSEQRMVAAIRRMPAGERRPRGPARPGPGMPDGVPVKVTVTVDPAQAHDRGRPARQPRLPAVRAQPHRGDGADGGDDGRLHGLGTVVPPNAGSFRRLRIHLRENCVVGIPQAPAQLLGSDDRPLRADREPRRARARRPRRRVRARARSAERSRPRWRSSPASTRAHGGGPFVNQLILAVTGGAGAPRARTGG